ncbi:peptidase [Marivita sp. S6314]|uniref:peptidase n=1 Tax=Marivita sp. S6314 TaxID=2926406 RepID=UPI001FF6EA12|nr:peptidase [Marivita sp. S6314]MCK0148806.1 peptidase [Marivita sp. S6314]
MTGVDVADCARSWVGTPYVHQASVKGAGADCLGVLRGVWRDLFGCEPSDVPVYTEDWAEPQGQEILLTAVSRHMPGKDLYDEAVGDVVLFRMRDASVAKHLGIQTVIGPQARFVHAYSGHGVVETSMSLPWQRRCVARFAFPVEHKE